MTIAQQLLDVSSAKLAIKNAIELKGVTVANAPFAGYAAKIAAISSGSVATPAAYTRPTDWLALPVLTVTDQKFVGLHQVWGDSDFVALSAAGAYTVNWGDGVIESFASNAVARHLYDFANVNLGAATSEGWKQAIITVTPQAGQNLNVLNLHIKHNQVGLPAYCSGFVDIVISGSYLTGLLISSTSTSSATQTIKFNALQKVTIVTSPCINTSYMLYNCTSLQSVNLSLPVCTTATQMLQNCTSLQSVTLSLPACTTALSMLYGCTSLQSITLSLPACTNASYMLYNCTSLQAITLSLPACMDATQMLVNCTSLQSVTLSLPVCTTTSAMLSGCTSLQSVTLSLPVCTTTSYMLQNCSSLQSVTLSLPVCTNTFVMLSGCTSLQSAVITGLKISTTINAKLSATALNALYTSLATVTNQTLTVTGNWGTAADNPAIATAKGWVVTG